MDHEPDGSSSAPSASRTYPTLSFIHINNPNESRLRSKKRAVRSHVAYYQHHKYDGWKEGDTSGSGAGVGPGTGTGTGTGPDPAPGPGSLTPESRRRRGSRAPSSQSRSDSRQLERHPSAAQSGIESQWRPHPDGSSQCQVALRPGSSIPTLSNQSPAAATTAIGTQSNQNSRRNSVRVENLLHGTRVDPFNSYPVPWRPDYDPILDFYLTNICQDVPSVFQPGKTFPLRTSWFPFILSSPKAFYAAMCLGSTIYHFNRGDLDQTPPSHLDLRVKAITAINESLTDPSLRADDFSIAAVFCMSCVESLFGDSAAYTVHMSGLAQMVHMRGGLHTLALDGLISRMIIWLDYNHARAHGSSMHFQQSIEASRRASPFDYEVIMDEGLVVRDAANIIRDSEDVKDL